MNEHASDEKVTGHAKRLVMRNAHTATLSTLQHDSGFPYGSLVNVATDCVGNPILLISTLAWHTKNLLEDPRASLLFCAPQGPGDPLQGTRVTVLGRLVRDDDSHALDRYLAWQPQAEPYAHFADFSVWSLQSELVHTVAGFGRIDSEGADAILVAEKTAETARELEADVVEHMREDHQDATDLIVRHIAGDGSGNWHMSGCDPDGALFSNGGRSIRVDFDRMAENAADYRRILAELTAKARKIEESYPRQESDLLRLAVAGTIS